MLPKLVVKLIITALALILVAYFLPGVTVSSAYIAVIVALLLGLLNVVLKPILVILTLPINIVTLGLFMWIINGFLFWFIATFVDGFDVDGFGISILAALIVSVVSWVGEQIFVHE